MAIITADIDYIQGHLRYGHYEMKLTGSQLEEFKSLSKVEQVEWIKDEGEIIVDDFEVDDLGEVSDCEINE